MGPKQLLGSIGAPGLCAKQTNIWTTERPAWGWADLQGPPLSGGWNHSLIPFHYSSPPPAPSLLPIHSLRIYPAASLTQHVSGQMSKNAPFNDTQQQEQEKKKPSTSIQSSLLWLARPLPPGFSQLMIDNVLLSHPGTPHAFLLDNIASVRQPGSPATGPWDPLGVFWERKKERPKGALGRGRPYRYKATRELNGVSLCASARARQQGEDGEPCEEVFLERLPTFFFFSALVRKATTLRLQRTKYILKQWKVCYLNSPF